MKKRVILPLLAVVMMALLPSCERENIIESTNTEWATFEVTPNMWKEDPNSKDLVCSMRWSRINNVVLAAGNVSAYLYEYQNGAERQVPLPDVYVVEWTDNGNLVYQPTNISYTIEREVITFKFSDLGDLLTNPAQLPTLRFRAVATWPVEYALPE